MSNPINNLNIFTFIKDIYQSLKHIDKNFNDLNTHINSRITNLEDNQMIILEKLSSIEMILNRINDNNTSNNIINKNIENELLDKMKTMNKNNLINFKVDLKPDELTFANILENDYSLSDISQSLSYSTINVKEEKTILNEEFKSSSSGSNYYSNSNSNNIRDVIKDGINNNASNVITDIIIDDINNNLNNLLF